MLNNQKSDKIIYIYSVSVKTCWSISIDSTVWFYVLVEEEISIAMHPTTDRVT